MNTYRRTVLTRAGLLLALAGTLTMWCAPARAQDTQAAGYHVGEQPADSDVDATVPDDAAGADESGNGPIRLARFSYLDGDVSWRPDDKSDWSTATVNLPLRPGAQVWVTGQGRAEVQFDDGSYLRLGDSAVAVLRTMNSNESGEFTEVDLNDGLATLDLRESRSMYEVNTRIGSVTAEGPARVRIGSDTGLEVAVREGQATVETEEASEELRSGDYVYLPVADSQLVVDAAPNEDSWDEFNDERDRTLAEGDKPSTHYLPASVEIVAGDLDDYGDWHNDPKYGEVWCPAVSDSDWRPYEHGHWVWVNPFGWTWVSEEQWGWAPYHYGTWVHEPWGWSWVPGPARQYWSPAVVHFTECDGDVAWVALAPSEVHYTHFVEINGFTGGDWWLHFSIGGCAVYEPHDDGCEPHPWRNSDINRGRAVVPQRPIGPMAPGDATFVPYNARHAEGVCRVASTQFGSAGGYRPVDNGADLFRRGRWSTGGGVPVAGPRDIAPTRESYTSTRTFIQGGSPPPVDRPVFHPRPIFQRGDSPDRSKSTPGGPTGNGPSTGHRYGWRQPIVDSGPTHGRPTVSDSPSNDGGTGPRSTGPNHGRSSDPARDGGGDNRNPSNPSHDDHPWVTKPQAPASISNSQWHGWRQETPSTKPDATASSPRSSQKSVNHPSNDRRSDRDRSDSNRSDSGGKSDDGHSDGGSGRSSGGRWSR